MPTLSIAAGPESIIIAAAAMIALIGFFAFAAGMRNSSSRNYAYSNTQRSLAPAVFVFAFCELIALVLLSWIPLYFY